MFFKLIQLQEKLKEKSLRLTSSFEKEYGSLVERVNQAEVKAEKRGEVIPGPEILNREGGDSTTVNNPLLSAVHFSNYLAVARIVKSLVEKQSHLTKIRILGVGEGAGVFASFLTSTLKPKVYLATDYQDWLVNYGRVVLGGGPLRFAQVDATTMKPIKDNSFDVVVACEFIEHIPTKKLVTFLKESRRVLKKRGVVIATTPNKGCHPGEIYSGYPHHETEFTAKELDSLIETHLIRDFGKHAVFFLVNKKICQEKRRRLPLELVVNHIFALFLKLFPKGSRREIILDKALTSLFKKMRKDVKRKKLTFPQEYSQTKLAYHPVNAKEAFGLCLVLQV